MAEPGGSATDPGELDLVVVGAHLSGQPLNHLLTGRGGRLVSAVRTAPTYRLVALPGAPPKPGLVRVAEGGTAIAGERWRLPAAGFAAVVAEIPSPLGIGRLLLDDGQQVPGFLCEHWALAGAPDISAHGGWLAYLAAGRP